MDKSIAQKLLQLNDEFYQTFANQFSDTRQRIQPGVCQIIDSINLEDWILDLGCGNGELARELLRRGYNGQYFGLDLSDELLDLARRKIGNNQNFAFAQANLADPDWRSNVFSLVAGIFNDRGSTFVNRPLSAKHQQADFNLILCFATLHHLPGQETHLQILRSIRNLLAPDGRFIHSNWQFLNSERLRKRIHPWHEVGLRDSDVDPGDYLIDWRRGGFGLRYVHQFNEAELNDLATQSGFQVVETFYSDGETGDLGLYQIWEISE